MVFEHVSPVWMIYCQQKSMELNISGAVFSCFTPGCVQDSCRREKCNDTFLKSNQSIQDKNVYEGYLTVIHLWISVVSRD